MSISECRLSVPGFGESLRWAVEKVYLQYERGQRQDQESHCGWPFTFSASARQRGHRPLLAIGHGLGLGVTAQVEQKIAVRAQV